ncbi:MAG: ATP synthase F0 sector subunit a [Candidatus Saccharicenans subterraneus]|uniref:ATP synthase subunit a n=1 Tax=Candidatus Saccharicenans subterraneus TaxID=2508984 RepID=A0A3E2BQL6_9BACT|nr:MAG: ATP synthase F0 sector subunit a [Candidatus Saccharicenans subterraneum]
MEGLEHSLPVVDFFNLILGRPLAALLAIFGLQVKDPAHLLPDYLVMTLIVAILLSILLGLAGRRVSLIPGKTQVVLESLIDFFEGMIVDTIGEQGKKYLPLVTTVGLFIMTSNLLGLIPGFMSPTSKLNVTLGCALVVWLYYHWQGIRTQGVFGYLKHFTGSNPFLAPLLLPIEIISHFSRPVSLSMRLFGNIFSEELLILIIASIIPYLLPLPFMAIAIFTAVIQAYVFVLLTCIYIAGAVAHEEEH